MTTKARNTSSTSLPIFVLYNADKKQWKYDRANTFTFSSLQQFVSTELNITQFVLTYAETDERSRRIVKDNHDLKKAKTSALNENRNQLQIHVNDEVLRQIPLCQFTTNDLCGTLKQSFHNRS
eukprot:269704_1